MDFLQKIKASIKPAVESDIYVQWLAFEASFRLPWLLPHDTDFLAIPKLLSRVQNPIVIDVGANIGLSALSVHKLLPSARIFSIEPNPNLSRYLNKLKERIPGFQYRICGAGRENSTLSLYVPRTSKVTLHTMSAFDRASVEKWCEKVIAKRYRSGLEIVENHVEVIPLDSIVNVADLIKIDVEGFELEVLLGSLKVIESSRPVLLIEYNDANFEQVREILSRLSYTPQYFDLSSGGLSPRKQSKNRNVYWVPVEHLH